MPEPAPAPAPAPDVVPPGGTLGVLGGGQLGRMFVHAAQRHGYRVRCWDQSPDAPAVRAADEATVAPFADDAALAEFAAAVDAVTVEFENVPAATLAGLAEHVPVRPGPHVLAVAQDRRLEKAAAAEAGFGTAPWVEVADDEQAAAAESFARPAILKTARDGYDGKGQIRLGEGESVAAAWAELGRVPCVLEGRVEFAAELSAVAARWPDGAVRVHGPFLNDHAAGVLDLTRLPAPTDPVVTAAAVDLAAGMAAHLDVVGLLTTEMFLTPGGELLVNEVAPRPHNSGHGTIECCRVSQFDQQVRTTANLPPGDPAPHTPGAMANLLGDLWFDDSTPRVPDWPGLLHAFPDVALHLYGKGEPRPGRKMGHLTATARDAETAARRVLAARTGLRGGDGTSPRARSAGGGV